MIKEDFDEFLICCTDADNIVDAVDEIEAANDWDQIAAMWNDPREAVPTNHNAQELRNIAMTLRNEKAK